eukprot:gene13673-15070_t
MSRISCKKVAVDAFQPFTVGRTNEHVVEAYALPIEYEEHYHQSGTKPLPNAEHLLKINHNKINIPGIKQYLTSCKWPAGLQETLILNLLKMPVRFFICDDSGSMNTDDDHRLYTNSQGVTKLINCTRWSGLTASLTFHANLAKAANSLTQFRFLNALTPITLGDGQSDPDAELERFLDLVNEPPSGKTPLCVHIREVVRQISSMADELRSKGQKACVVIASDGESTDGDVADALRPLEHLPAWVVIRLCTDEEKIVNYWNSIDNDLELDMDVLDDLEAEAKEIEEVNHWLTYGEPLHQLREFGIPIKEIDLLDEATLTLDQIRLFASLLRVTDYPHPEEDWPAFVRVVNKRQRASGRTWSPINKRQSNWIETAKIKGSQRGSKGGYTQGCVIL